jgi:acetyltransferase
MQHLVKYAQKEELDEIYGEVLGSNQTMLKMCAEMGFKINADDGDVGVRHVRLRFDKSANSALPQ